jgi:tRNA (guanine37-N1)-methyltransferase
VLLSGHHVNIENWRERQSLLRTWQRRPELIDRSQLSKKQLKWLDEFERGESQA